MRSILNSFGPWVLWQLAPGQGWGYSTGRGAKPIFLSLDPAKKPLPGPGRGGVFYESLPGRGPFSFYTGAVSERAGTRGTCHISAQGLTWVGGF